MLLNAEPTTPSVLGDEEVQLWLNANRKFFASPSTHQDKEYFVLEDVAGIATKYGMDQHVLATLLRKEAGDLGPRRMLRLCYDDKTGTTRLKIVR